MLALLRPCAGRIEAGSYYGYTYAVAHILVYACTHNDVCLDAIAHAEPDDLILTLGGGDIYRCADILVKKYQART